MAPPRQSAAMSRERARARAVALRGEIRAHVPQHLLDHGGHETRAGVTPGYHCKSSDGANFEVEVEVGM